MIRKSYSTSKIDRPGVSNFMPDLFFRIYFGWPRSEKEGN